MSWALAIKRTLGNTWHQANYGPDTTPRASCNKNIRLDKLSLRDTKPVDDNVCQKCIWKAGPHDY